jgi:hypothetical protein
MPTIASRTAATALLALLSSAAVLLSATPAEAAAYRYWGYYTWSDGAWTFAQTGPDQSEPADGSVEGWRFAVTTESGSPRVPRTDGDFTAICAGTEAADGRKRVAVVIDAGLPADAPEGATPPEPRGACASVPESASGAEVLAAVAPTRVEGGLVCAVDDYPATGCGEEVDIEPPATPDAQVDIVLPAPRPTPTPTTGGDPAASGDGDDDGTPWEAIVLGAAVVAAIGGAAAWRLRGGAPS